MDTKLIFAIITITLALIFYTIGVFSERKSGTLKLPHVIIFWLGLIFDITGTTIMSSIAQSNTIFNLHGITGILAIALMLFHACWSTIVLVKKDEKKAANFHKSSIIVWAIWLIPYFSGVFVGMTR